MMDLKSIEFTDDIPVYQQLGNYFMTLITSGKLKVGDALPTEETICNDLHISRATARKAMQLLEDEGRVVRKRRKGTYVCEQKLSRNLNNLYNFTTEMNALGIQPSSKLISFETIKASSTISNILNVGKGENVYWICRLRIADEKPLLLETAYIPVYLCPHLESKNLTDSLYSIISENTGFPPGEATETYEAINLNSNDAIQLECSSKSAALKITRVSKNTAGQIFEYCTIIARGDMNKYQITLKNKGIAYTRVI